MTNYYILYDMDYDFIFGLKNLCNQIYELNLIGKFYTVHLLNEKEENEDLYLEKINIRSIPYWKTFLKEKLKDLESKLEKWKSLKNSNKIIENLEIKINLIKYELNLCFERK